MISTHSRFYVRWDGREADMCGVQKGDGSWEKQVGAGGEQKAFLKDGTDSLDCTNVTYCLCLWCKITKVAIQCE